MAGLTVSKWRAHQSRSNAAGLLHSATIQNGAACELTSQQSARCALPTWRANARFFVGLMAEFAEPGKYDVTFAAAAPGDTANDKRHVIRPVIVRPYNDIAVSASRSAAADCRRDEVEEVHPCQPPARLSDVALRAASYIPACRGFDQRHGGPCQVDPSLGGVCGFNRSAGECQPG